MNWQLGLNFSRAKYKILTKDTFIPHVQSNFKATLPIEILNNFVTQVSDGLVALLEIYDIANKKSVTRIKKLCKCGNSFVFSLEKERQFKNIAVKVLAVKDIKECLARSQLNSQTLDGNLPTLSVLPTRTLNRSFPYENCQEITPLFTFEYGDKLYCGSYFGWKNLILKKEIALDEVAAAALGLYFAEGGKTAASFTNSQPLMINVVLDFVEGVTNIERKNVSATIYCHPSLVNKKRNLEDFWSSQTGIIKFSSHLHLSNNSRSPCGTLELKFCSIILKELFCGLLKSIFNNPSLIDAKTLIKGIFSAESSPTKQSKSCITHHITLDKNNWRIQFSFIHTFLSRLGIKLDTVPSNPSRNVKQVHAVVYSDWLTNLMMLLLDVYQFNLINREKFGRQFLSLPKTSLLLKLKDGNIVTGDEIVSGIRIHELKKLGLVSLNQISPKPHRKYEIYFTEKGKEIKKLLQNFVNKVYPHHCKDIEKFYKTLEEFGLPRKVIG